MPTIHEFDLGKGLDARSSENQIPEGHAESVNNATFINTRVAKRKGYQQSGGFLPVRAFELIVDSANPNNFCIEFDSSIDVSRTIPGPIRVVGKADIAWSDVAANAFGDKWYSTFSIDLRYTGNKTVPQDVVGFSAASMLAGATISTNLANLSNTQMYPDLLRINKSNGSNNFNNIDFQVSGSSSWIPYFLDASSGAPNFLTKSINLPANTLTTVATSSELSNLVNSNCIVQVYSMNAATLLLSTTLEFVIPDQILITATGNLQVKVTNAGDYFIVIHTPPAANSIAGTAIALSTTTETIDSDNAFIFPVVYTFNPDGSREVILPDTVEYDDITRRHNITFTNTSTSAVNYQIYWAFGGLRINRICIGGQFTGSPVTTTNLEMDVYGIDHKDLHTSGSLGGRVHHIDVYRSETSLETVVGIGGNFYVQQPINYATLLPKSRVLLTADHYLAPAFQETGSLAPRSRGRVTFDGGLSNLAEVESVTHLTGTSVQYVLNTPNVAVIGGTPIAINKDKLTVTNMGYEVNNGEFTITSITYGTNTITVTVDNPNREDSVWDEIDAGGRAGVFTDIISSVSSLSFMPFAGDVIVGGGIPSGLSVVYSSATEIILTGVISSIQLTGGTSFYSQRKSAWIPLKESLLTQAQYVPGDMLTFSGITNLLKIKRITVGTDETVSITNDIITVSNALPFSSGQLIGIDTGDARSGVYSIVNVLDNTRIEVSGIGTVASAKLLKNAIEVDEAVTYSETVNNSIFFNSTSRWYAITKPNWVSDVLANKYVPQMLDFNPYELQPIVRSTTLNDSMYFTNHDDEVMKYDGTSIFQAGLQRWEPVVCHSFLNTANGGGSLGAGTYKYLFQLLIIDSQGKITQGTAIGSGKDFVITTTATGSITFKLTIPPFLGVQNYENMILRVYRSLNAPAPTAPYYLVTSVPVEYKKSGSDNIGHVYISDGIDENTLKSSGEVNVLTEDFIYNLEAPLRAKHISTLGDQLLLANLRDYPRLQLTAAAKGNTATTDYAGLKVTLTQGISSQTYEFINDPPRDISAYTRISDNELQLTHTGSSISAGQWVYIYPTASTNTAFQANYFGWFQVKSSTVNTIKIVVSNLPNPLPTFSGNMKLLHKTNVIPIASGLDYNYIPSIAEIGVGEVAFGARLARAINAIQALVPSPICLAFGTLDRPRGTLELVSPIGKNFSVTLDAPDASLPSKQNIFVDGVLANWDSTYNSRVQSFPSRVIASVKTPADRIYEGFMSPRAQAGQLDSISIVDINPADGQEITGIIPFFGESVTGSGSKQGLLIVFKESSIYTVDLSTREYSKIDSRGVGCTAPYSITYMPSGIMFANEAGIYALTRSFEIEWIGRNIDRLWKEQVNIDSIEEATATTYPLEQMYKLSVPAKGETKNSLVFVFHYGETGAWSKWDSHPVAGWANFREIGQFASLEGKVFTVRQTGEFSDYRDDSSAISFIYVHRPLHFGDPGIRKRISNVLTNFRVLVDSDNTTLSISTDLGSNFIETSKFTIDYPQATDGLSDSAGTRVITTRHSVPSTKATYFQVKIENNAKDEPVEIAGMSFAVTGLSIKGIKEAKDT